ncbi:MAG: heavy metal translocating P-type ATPase, partial [Clostridia bacterium]|nr:heavy metal translocating P-type ATPase [Clostridia bacterium]
LEAFTMDKTRKSIRELMELAPAEALVKRNGLEMLVPVDELAIGEQVIIKPGTRIPIDGRVVEGRSSVNQAPITGESIPAPKEPGDEVFAGTVNEKGLLVVEVTRLAADTTLARVIKMVEEAQAEKAPAERFVDVFAKYYTPAVIALAALIAIVPPLVFGADGTMWFYRAITLLVVACPCALVISTPVAIVAAIGNAAKQGVLIKGGAHLEQAGKIKAIAFDKTGTLTRGQPVVSDVIPAPAYSIEDVLTKAAAVETGSEHPLGGAIINELNRRGLTAPGAKDFAALTGRGAKALVDHETFYVGNPDFFVRDLGLALGNLKEQVRRLEEQGKTIIMVGSEKEILGAIACGDTLSETGLEAVAALKKQGIKRVMLTGDNAGTAKFLARELELDSFRAGLLPEEKVSAIKELAKEYGPVAMVGDGINDAPALAAANVGIAMGGAGTDTALETADIALMADDLSKLPFTIRLSHKALSIIRQNIAFSLIVKLAAVTMVFPGILNLWIAIVADTGAALIVIANGMRLLKVK